MTLSKNPKVPTVDASKALGRALKDSYRIQNILLARICASMLPITANQTAGGLPKRGKETLVRLLTEQAAADRELINIIDEQRTNIRAAAEIIDRTTIEDIDGRFLAIEGEIVGLKLKK
ncbi:hypothetical protein [Methylorubrum aminovorans]